MYPNREADYSLCYGGATDLSCNLIIVEAEFVERFGIAKTEALGYMGKHNSTINGCSASILMFSLAMVHAACKKLGKKNTTIYGFCTNYHSFDFYEIDNQGKVAMRELHTSFIF